MPDIGNIPDLNPKAVRERELRLAVERLGRSNLQFHHKAFAVDAMTMTQFTSGGGGIVLATDAGLIRASAPAVAGAAHQLYSAIPGAVMHAVPGGSAAEWYYAGRMARLTGVPSGTMAVAVGGSRAGASVYMGAIGAASGTHFALRTETTNVNIVSSVALDTALHTFRSWRKAGITYFEIDGALQGSAAGAYPNASIGLDYLVFAGAGAVACSGDFEWICCATPEV